MTADFMTADLMTAGQQQRKVPVAPPQAANDRLLLDASDPSLRSLLQDLKLVRGLIADGLSLDHLKLLSDCAERSERAFLALRT